MSVTVRYHGSLKDWGRLEEMQEEFLDFAITSQWPSEIVDGAYTSLKREETRGKGGAVSTLSPALTLKGIKLFVHPQTDPLWFTFDAEGTLTRLSYFAVNHFQPKAGQSSRRFEFIHQSQASIQTRIGGMELHKTVISLLDHFKKHYVPGLKVDDDSGYWDKRNDEDLRLHMQRGQAA